MNVLITSEFYTPHVGGAEKVVQILAEGFVELGHSVVVATTEIPGRSLNVNGVEILEFAIYGNAAKLIKEKRKGEKVRYQNLLKSNKQDVILQYAAQTWHTDLTFPILNEITTKIILVPCGFSGLTTFLRRVLYFRYFKKMPKYLQGYDELVFLSENYLDTNFARKNGIKDFKIIPNGIFTSEFDQNNLSFKNKYGIDVEKKIYLNVSNHYKLKGHKELIKAFTENNDNESLLVIIGNDPKGNTSCLKDCQKMVADHKNVILLHDVPREFVIAAYKESDVFVLSSYIEYYPLVLIEAMYCKLPIVSMNVGCVKDYCDCILVEEYPDLAAALKLVKTSDQSNKVEKNFAKVVEVLQWDAIINQYNLLLT